MQDYTISTEIFKVISQCQLVEKDKVNSTTEKEEKTIFQTLRNIDPLK